MRRDKVLAALAALCQASTGDELHNKQARQGFTTDEIAQHAGILRNNCSADLNVLVRAGLVLKDKGRPTRYTLKTLAESLVEQHADPNGNAHPSLGPMHNLHPLIPPHRSVRSEAVHPQFQPTLRPEQAHAVAVVPTSHTKTSGTLLPELPAFDWGLGSAGSLREAIQQGQMAVSYPPHGMHTLLVGETGVGKSTFAHTMHAFASRSGVLSEEAPFISFNCAEYANNPEILLDQLFGHVRGAYTGAAQDKSGLIEHAHGGMLFLDEVHRLPPEGQEILFHLLDYGEYRRLGESRNSRRAQVLLVAATTESPESVLLATFRRRIPVVIRIPALREWSIDNRYELLFRLVREEARVLQRTIRIESGALEKMLFGVYPANIGGLKNLLRLACARVYSANPAGEQVVVRSEHVILPPQTKSFRPSSLRIMQAIPDMVVVPHDVTTTVPAILTEDAWYGKLDRLGRALQGLGFEGDEILSVMERELARKDESTAMRQGHDELRRFVGDTFYGWMQSAWGMIQHRIDREQQEMAFTRVAMHLFGLSKTGFEVTQRPLPPFVEGVQADSPQLYQAASDLLSAFTLDSGLRIPSYEVPFVAILLRPMAHTQAQRLGIVVAMYGEAVASSIVETALQLSTGATVQAVDVPLQATQSWIDECVVQALDEVDTGHGILLMTDVPTLRGFPQRASFLSASVVHVFESPDTRSVVKAIECAHLPVTEVITQLSGWPSTERLQPEKAEIRLIVWSCCLTGKGTAHAMRRFVQDGLPDDLASRVDIVPKELSRQAGGTFAKAPGLVAAVGSIDPFVPGVPFFSVEELLNDDGMNRLINLLYWGQREDVLPVVGALLHQHPGDPPSVEQPSEMERHVRRLLEKDLVFLNPTLVLQVCRDMESYLLTQTGNSLPAEQFARFCLHTAYMIERLVQGDAMAHPDARGLATSYPQQWNVMTSMWKSITEVFQLPPQGDEIAYLLEFFFSEQIDEVNPS